jgi:hypothetical protein
MLRLISDDFIWQQTAGRRPAYAWAGTGDDRCLVEVPGARFKSYRPHPGIFRDFASLDLTPASVLHFANRYGPLRETLELNSFAFWRQGIRDMTDLVGVSDALTGGDWKTIRRALEPFLADACFARADDLRPIRQRQRRGEKVPPNLWADAAVMRLYHAIRPVQRFQGEGSWNDFTGSVELRLRAGDLLDFMFLELGNATLGNLRFWQCAACGRWFLLKPGVNRADRTTCTGYCRLKLSRQRKSRALELHRSGWSPERIAREIDSHLSTVKRWLA